MPRKSLLRRAVLLGLILGLSVGPRAAVGLDQYMVSIATGGRTGVYYFAGGTICGYLNALRWQSGIRCIVQSTFGSIDNLNAVRSGRATFGIVQSDWQYHAANGTSVFEANGPDSDLRALFSLYPEPLTVIARPDAGIERFEDLLEKRVSLGPVGSGGRATMEVVMGALGWTESDFAYAANLPMDELGRALCSGEIDAAVFIVAHPNLTVDNMVNDCDARLVPLDNPKVDALVAAQPYYVATEILSGTYPGQSVDIPAFAMPATMVASARTPPSLVEALVGAVFENLGALIRSHPAFSNLDPQAMVTNGLTAPLHVGAERYYEAHGLLPAPEPGG